MKLTLTRTDREEIVGKGLIRKGTPVTRHELFFQAQLTEQEAQLAKGLNGKQVIFSVQQVMAGHSIDFDFVLDNLVEGTTFDFGSPAQRLEVEEKIKEACSSLKSHFEASERGSGDGTEEIEF